MSIYCHVMKCDYRGVLDLIIGFIGLFDTACDYTLQFTITHTLVSTVTSSLLLLGSGSQRRTFHSSGFLNGPRSQLPGSNSNS
jgi:hypothetical protein